MSFVRSVPVRDTAICGRVFIAYHPATSTPERAENEARVFANFARGVPSCSVLVWVGRPFPPPSDEVKQIFLKAFANAKIDAAAYVVADLAGLSRSLVGSVATQMFVGGRTSVPVRVFTDPLEAAQWLVEQNEVGTTAAEILGALEELDRLA
ncbi:hypothetical protein ACNOYE_32940 [Nannocystaceae bacterium ST9]